MAHMLTIDEKRRYAETLYLRGDLDQKEIAQIVQVSEKTMSNWVNDEKMGWKAKRKSYRVTKEAQIARLYNIIDKITQKIDGDEGLGDTKEADKLIKYTAALKNLETESSLAEIMEVAMLFTKFLQPIDPALALQVSNHFDLFIKDRLKRF